MSELLERAISPFESHKQDVGIVALNFARALYLLPVTWVQSPHWQQEPTQDMLDEEARWNQEAADAKIEIKNIAADIYFALTGEEVA